MTLGFGDGLISYLIHLAMFVQIILAVGATFGFWYHQKEKK